LTRELGVSDSTIQNWRKQLAQHGSDAFPGSGHQTPLEEENRRLKRELEKEECVDWQRDQTRLQARSSIFAYIEMFDNRKHRHSSPSYQSPAAYEELELWKQKEAYHLIHLT